MNVFLDFQQVLVVTYIRTYTYSFNDYGDLLTLLKTGAKKTLLAPFL